ncbi:MAG: hypothetical protein JW873_04625 [Candidatus Saganbacteria bacterium]|nr:hypothetical protein [Candidatus Saganbacteria bacterium]
MIGTATVDLRSRTMNGGWGLLRRTWPIPGMAEASAMIAGHALSQPAIVSVTGSKSALALVFGENPHKTKPIPPSPRCAEYLSLAGVKDLFFPAETGRENIELVLASLCHGHKPRRLVIEIRDSRGRPVPTATWATFYPDESKLTLLQRASLRLHELISKDCNIRYLLPALEQPGGTIETVREQVRSNLADLRRRNPFLPAVNVNLITGYYQLAAATIESAIEKNAPTIAQQLDPIRTINFL